tara:strand:- start:372 stop:1268 length:897 start_codon:yes stop_codon:yes gene_type:complete
MTPEEIRRRHPAAATLGTNEENYVAATASIAATDTTVRSLPAHRDRADAYGQTFVLAPTFCLRLGAEDAMLLSAAVKQEGLAVFLHSELSGKPQLSGSFEDAVAPGLTTDARRVWTEDNAGGSSRNSEALSMEVLARAFEAVLHKTEMQLRYFPSNGAITDMCIAIGGEELGVSVTRALGPPHRGFTDEDAEHLLRKKLDGVLKATATCFNASWRKQLLHVWAADAAVALALERAYSALPPALTADTVVLVTVCHGMPEIFDERAPPKPCRAPRPLKGEKDERHLQLLRESEPNCAWR